VHRGVPTGVPAARSADMTEPWGGPQQIRAGAMPALADSFVARPETAPGLTTALAPGTVAALVPAPVAADGAAEWLAPSGRTQLAVGFAESLWQSRAIELLVWVNATSRPAVLAGYAEAAAAMMTTDPAGDAEATVARFLAWLRETPSPWLIVLDGLTAAEDLAGLWPGGPAGRVLVTAADPAAAGAGRPGGDGPPVVPLILPVGVFSPREALSYLMGRLTADPDQRLGAIDLIKDLGCEPLALAQASAVIASSALTCRDYRDYFLRRREQLAAPDSDLPAAAVTWTFCVEQADRLSPDGTAQAMLALAALLDGRGIPGAIFTTAAVRGYVGGDGAEAPADRERIRGGLLMTQRAGLLTIDVVDTQATIRMNPVVQAAIQSAMPAEMLDRLARLAADALLEAWPAQEPEPWLAQEFRSGTARLQEAAGDVLWAGGCHPVLIRAGESLDHARLADPAVAYWRELATVSDRVLGSDHPDTLVAGEHLATAYLAAGRAAEGVPWFQWVLAKRVHGRGPDHPSTIAARRDLGSALAAASQLTEAIGVLDTAANDYERVSGADHLDTLGARDDLMAAYISAGQYDDAIKLGRKLLSDRERGQGGQHPAVTSTRRRLADAYLAAGQYKDAINQYKKVLSDTERAQGRNHLDAVIARGHLGSAYHAAGKMANALQFFEQARDGYVQVLGEDHPETLARSASLANAYYAAGRLMDAATLLRDTAARCDRVLPAGDPLTATVRESLASIGGLG
jgi:tetratricopeptide (TPR) repeat protein